MKIIHTSDWHLGRTLCGRRRDDDVAAFMQWLIELIEYEDVRCLLIAGDVFDNTTPSHSSQTLYYQFLLRLSQTCCRHVVIVAGNHDSPSFLEAPRALLSTFNIHVVGDGSRPVEEQVLVMNDGQGHPEAIICAVPYLREKDMRSVRAAESIDEKGVKLRDGIAAHYRHVIDHAGQIRDSLGVGVPILAMGHLFTAGGVTMDGDGVRNLYVGHLGAIHLNDLPNEADYYALGHLHVPQMVGERTHCRYSGSPYPVNFAEAKQDKSVVLIESGLDLLTIEQRVIPRFRQLITLKGDRAWILTELARLKESDQSTWVEIQCEDGQSMSALREEASQLITGTTVDVLRFSSPGVVAGVLHPTQVGEQLAQLTVYDVFDRCLEHHEVDESERKSLMDLYHEVVRNVLEEDILA